MTRENASRQTTTTYFLSCPLAKTLALLLATLGLCLPARAQTPVVEAKNADEATVLQVNADGGLLGLGAFDTGMIPAEGPGPRLMWHPAKALSAPAASEAPEAMGLEAYAQVIGRAWEAASGTGEHRVTVAVGLDRAGALVEHLQRQQTRIDAHKRRSKRSVRGSTRAHLYPFANGDESLYVFLVSSKKADELHCDGKQLYN